MKMLNNNVLVAEVQKEEKTAGGIILSSDAKLDKGAAPGLVLAYGPNCDNVKKGDRVYLQWSESMPINHEGKAAVIVSEEFIKAVIE
jgi:co-chaperonin GroES (HSP10)